MLAVLSVALAPLAERVRSGQLDEAWVDRADVIAAMLEVPREQFVPDSRRDVAYVGENVELVRGRVLLVYDADAPEASPARLRSTRLAPEVTTTSVTGSALAP